MILLERIVSIIKLQTESEEELADALLDLVQDKGHILNIRYYPTSEHKYPVGTLVEMGGDCDTHTILYTTLLKAAGFKVFVLLSEDGSHVAVAVHQTLLHHIVVSPPTIALNMKMKGTAMLKPPARADWSATCHRA